MTRDYYDTPEGKRQLHLYLLGVNDSHLPRSKRSRQRKHRRDAVMLLWASAAIFAIILVVVTR